MRVIYRRLKAAVPEIQWRAGTRSLFEARVFADLCVVARAVADEAIAGGR